MKTTRKKKEVCEFMFQNTWIDGETRVRILEELLEKNYTAEEIEIWDAIELGPDAPDIVHEMASFCGSYTLAWYFKFDDELAEKNLGPNSGHPLREHYTDEENDLNLQEIFKINEQVRQHLSYVYN